MADKLPPGIKRRSGGGFRVFVRIHHGPGGLPSKCFPAGSGMLTMRRWQEDQRTKYRHPGALPEAGGTLRADVRAYLAQVQTMPTLRNRKDDLERWIAAFGPNRLRKSITAGEIRTQLETWRKDYAANTVNHRRTALMHLWSVLDGKSAPNPARDVPRYADESRDAAPRALSTDALRWLLRAMPYSQSKARAALMRWTGWPQAQIMKLTPGDIRWGIAVRVQPRRKGRGAAGAWLPLLPHAWRVLRSFKRLGAWGPFSTSSLRKSLRLAAAKVCANPKAPAAVRDELADVTPYQLRHSFLTMIAALTQDDRAVKVLAQHADIRTTHRYTEATADPRAAAAIAHAANALRQAKVSTAHS